jgi:hypothetical protein
MVGNRKDLNMDQTTAPRVTWEKKAGFFDWLALWIVVSAWSSFSGWGLSLCGYLNSVGILLSYALFFGTVFLFRSHLRDRPGLTLPRIVRSRFLPPKIWLALTVLALIGGMIYSPNNYDYLTYRFSRVLYWTWNHGWTWIPTVNERMNISGTGFEWLMVPLFILFKTDRLFFLINFVPYILLPGLVFSVFSRLGISKRISWWWMWILPSGYCYILQAASVGNDSLAAIYFLASLHYLFSRGDPAVGKNLPLSCLAIALTTGVKASTVPLILPWLVVLFFQRKHLFRETRLLILAASLIVAAVISFLPVALANTYFTGDYAGDPHNLKKMKLSNPVSAVLGNSLQLAKDSLVPPLLPRTIDWLPVLPAGLSATLVHDFPLLDLHSGELQVEEEAGLGLGIVIFMGLFVVVAIGARFSDHSLIGLRSSLGLWVGGAGLIAFLAYMSKMGIPPTSRLVAAYYPLLIAGLLIIVSLDGRTVQRSAFKWIGFLALASAMPLVILSPARPLIPVHAVSNFLTLSHVPAPLVKRYDDVYGAYATRSDAFKDLVVSIPPDQRVIGFLQNGDDSAACLWLPFGTRKVSEVTPDNSKEEVKAMGIHFLIVGQDALADRYHTTIDSLEAKWSASLVAKKDIILKAHRGPETWYLLSL